VEVQFYALAALIVKTMGTRGLYCLPLLCVLVTALRIIDGEVISIVTWHRADEILVGAAVALAYNHGKLDFARRLPGGLVVLLASLLVLSGWSFSGAFGYLRPYIAGAMVAVSIFSAPALLERIWCSGTARYIASISYALYVVHGMLTATPLGGQDTGRANRYALRVPLGLLTWALAHLSTRYYERFFMDWGKRLAR
jgi:peptidoglycan/LPS O-acetylase OafA/YrhL